MSAVYVGFWKSCDCIAAAVVDNPEHIKDTAKDVSGFIRRGFRVQRFPDGIRDLPFRCVEHPEGTPEPWKLEKAAAGRPVSGRVAR